MSEFRFIYLKPRLKIYTWEKRPGTNGAIILYNDTCARAKFGARAHTLSEKMLNLWNRLKKN